MPEPSLQSAIESVPAGAWGVGVSGGADSVALLSLLRTRPDLSLVVVHLDHETRGGASAEDARFVKALAERHRLPCVVATRSEIEPGISPLPSNISAKYRAVRFELFCRVVRERRLDGVILAHHADDQAETVLHRLLRGAGPAGLGGMSPRRTLGDLLVLRPLLAVRRDALRAYLKSTGEAWREDESNASLEYARNRARALLARRPKLIEPLLDLGEACEALRAWLDASSPALEASFALADVRDLAPPLARESLRRWLIQRGAPAGDLDAAAVERLLAMTRDAATAPRQHFPGGILVGRRQGRVSALTSS